MMNQSGTAFGPMSKASSLQQQPALKRCQSNVQPLASTSGACPLEPITETEAIMESKDDGGLLKCKKIELHEEEEGKSTGSSHEATSDDLNEKEPVKGKKHRRN